MQERSSTAGTGGGGGGGGGGSWLRGDGLAPVVAGQRHSDVSWHCTGGAGSGRHMAKLRPTLAKQPKLVG